MSIWVHQYLYNAPLEVYNPKVPKPSSEFGEKLVKIIKIFVPHFSLVLPAAPHSFALEIVESIAHFLH